MVSFCFPWGLIFFQIVMSQENRVKNLTISTYLQTLLLFLKKPQHISVQSKNSALSRWNKFLRVKPLISKVLVKHLLLKSEMRSWSSYCIQKTGNLPFSYIKRKQVHPRVNLCDQKQAGILQCRLPQHLLYKPNYPSLHRCKRHPKCCHLRHTDNFKSL